MTSERASELLQRLQTYDGIGDCSPEERKALELARKALTKAVRAYAESPATETAPESANVKGNGGSSMQSLTLFDRESFLASLESIVETVEPDHEEEFLEEYARALQSAIQKRDACAWFLATQDGRVEMIEQEIARLEKLKYQTAKRIERVERIVTRAIEFLGVGPDGKYRKLEGNTSVFSLAQCPPSVEIIDIEQVPREYKKVTVTMPAELWDRIADGFDPDLIADVQQHAGKASECADKRAIKQELDRGYDVPGADLSMGRQRLVRA